MWFNPPHPTPLPPGHECYFLWAQCDHDGQVRIKMSAHQNVTELELKRFIDLNRFNVPESKLCFLNSLPLIVTRLGCVSNGNLLQCFSPFKKNHLLESKKIVWKKNQLSLLCLQICLLSSGFLFAKFISLDIWLLSSLCHQLIWKKKLNSRRGKALCTVWKMVKTPSQVNSQEFMWFSSLSD